MDIDSATAKRKLKFQFSLRLMLLAMVLFSVSAVSYLKFRRIQIPVPANLDHDDGYYPRFLFIYETQNPFTASSVRKNHAASEEKKRIYAKANIEERMQIWQEEYKRQQESRKKERSPQQREYYDAIELAKSGDTTGFSKLVNRHLSGGQQDQEKLLQYAQAFPPKMVCQNELLLNLIKDRIEKAGLPSIVEAKILHLGEIDSQPLIDGLKWQIKNSTSDFERRWALDDLLKVSATEDSFRLALEIFEDPESMASGQFECHELISKLLAIDGFAEAAGGEFKARLVKTAFRYMKDDSWGDNYFVAIAKIDSPEFIDFFRQTVKEPRYKSRRNWALGQLEKHGEEGEASRALDAILAKDTFPDDVLAYFYKRDGREAVFRELAKRLATNKSYPMLKEMCKLAEGDNREIAKSICENVIEDLFDKSSPYFKKYGVIDLLADLGYENIDQLRRRVPVTHGWRQGQKPGEEFVDWVNRNLDPINQVNAASVFEGESSSFADEGSHNPHWFRVFAMEAAGRAGLIDPQDIGFESDFFAEIAKLGGEKFQIEAHDRVDCKIRLLIDGLIYSFDFDDSEAWFDVVVSCEMLNVILKRHKIEERFFVFNEPMGNSYVLFVLFAKPTAAKELADKYGNPFVKGCEVYWRD